MISKKARIYYIGRMLSRFEYKKGALRSSDLTLDPFAQFSNWYAEAEKELKDPSAMCLATSNEQGDPSCRMVLLKGFNQDGFLFFTNTESRKAQDIHARPLGAITFYWEELERQVRASGNFIKIPAEESDAYFASRPRRTQLGAWASHQDSPLINRVELEAQYQAAFNKYLGKKIPRPPYWEGYRLVPNQFEFWQGRENRLHDRFEYTKNSNGAWDIVRLSP